MAHVHDARRRRRSLRLKWYDYSRAGAYFVTIITQGRLCVFGEVVGEEMRLNEVGSMAGQTWEALPRRFPGIGMDAFVVMPNHIHGIVIINPPVGVSLVDTPSTPDTLDAPDTPDILDAPDNVDRATTRGTPTLGDVVGAYKSLTTVEYTRGVKTLNWPPFERRLWQRNYYEHTLRTMNP